jgi:signal transduction histidine kinase
MAATVIDGKIQVVISNRVRQNPDSAVARERFALGLDGLEARVTSFGGNFSFEKDTQQATLFMALEIVE